MKKIIAFTMVLAFLIICVFPTCTVSAAEPLKVLAIGHSYAVNANQYVWSIANMMGENIEIHTLYYAGCSLERHVKSYETDRKDYLLYKNGATDHELTDMKTVLDAEKYDVITFQQSPGGSSSFGTFESESGPYLSTLAAYVRKHQTDAEFMIHQTWAFSTETLNGEGDYGKPGYSNSTEHFADIEDAYDQAAKLLGDVKIIKSGEAIELAKGAFNFGRAISDNDSLYADTVSHLSDAGKYLTACVWVETLLGKDVRTTEYLVGAPKCELLREIAHEVVSGEQSTVFDNLRVLENQSGYTLVKDYREVGEDGVVTIPAYVNGKLITQLDKNLYTGRKDVKEIVMPRTVKSFDSGTFTKFKLTFVEAQKPVTPFYKAAWFYVAVGGAVVLLAAVVVIIAIKKRKKQKA